MDFFSLALVLGAGALLHPLTVHVKIDVPGSAALVDCHLKPLLPLASHTHCTVAKRIENFLRIESQATSSLDEGDALQVHPVVERTLGDVDHLGHLVDVDQLRNSSVSHVHASKEIVEKWQERCPCFTED